MKSCKSIRQFFIEALYDELDADHKTEFNYHLDNCPHCAGEFNEMKNTLGIMSQKKDDMPEEHFWKTFPDRVIEGITEEETTPVRFTSPRWGYQMIGAAAMVLVGIFIGYYLSGKTEIKQEVAVVRQHPHVMPASVQKQAANYLEKSKILLLGMVNIDTDQIQNQSMDFSHQKDVSRSLIQEAAVLKKNLSKSDQLRLTTLISELELIMMQISNYEQQFDVPAIELIKSSVDNQSILMKINLEEMIMFNQSFQKDNANTKDESVRL